MAVQLSPTALALPLDDKRAQLQDLNSQIRAAKNKQDEASKQQAAVDLQIQLSNRKLVEVQQKLNNLQMELNDTVAKRRDAEANLAESQKRLDETGAKLAAAKRKLAIRQKIFNNRMVGVYKSGEQSFVVFLIGSQSFGDFINRAKFMSIVAEADSKLVLGIKELAATIANQLSLIEATKKTIDEERQRLVAAENTVKTITNSIVAEQTRLQDEATKQQQLYAQIQQEKNQLARTTGQLLAGASIISGQISLLEGGGNLDIDVTSSQLRELATGFAAKYGIPAKLFFALITVESGWNYQAVSRAGAIGLTQVMHYNVTAMGYNLESFRNSPSDQLELGARYLSMQYQTFGRWDYALAAYNAGPGAVLKYGGIPPYAETQNYVKKILAMAA